MKIDPKEIYEKIPQVLKYKKILDDLGQNWNTLNLLNQVNDSGESMEKTQNEFQMLSEELLLHLADESLKQLSNEVSSKSQVVIDILIRNLFERTADIGFLATDDGISDFIQKYTLYNSELHSYKQFDSTKESCKQCPIPFQTQCASKIDSILLHSMKDILCATNNSQRQHYLQNQIESIKEKIKIRFQEYTQKYSVYFDVIVTDTSGEVLVALENPKNIKKSEDLIIQEALKTSQEFVEYYGVSSFSKQNEPLLLYAYRIYETNQKLGEPIGVLILCFKFENELEGIFSFLNHGKENFTMGILDQSNTMIASSNKHHFPIGTKLKNLAMNKVSLIDLSGKKYLIKISQTRGYQGFYGLGWKGCCFVAVEDGFYDDQSNILQSVDTTILETVMSSPSFFSKELQEIPHKAKKIQNDLSRTVWNGSLKQQTLIAKKLLSQVATTGQKTNLVFNDSINSLHETVLKTMLDVVSFEASLGIDIMDRNLYERANDCRWWALTDQFKTILSKNEYTNEDKKILQGVLESINALYTVYVNLFVYDNTGTILAVSNDAFKNFIGMQLQNETVKNTLQNRDSQKYFVSPFEKNDLYNQEPTYIYHASITNHTNEKNIGGIGIVFDASLQFQAILEDILPNHCENCFAVFVDSSHKIIASSNNSIQIGSYLEIPDDFFRVEKSQTYSSIIQYNGAYFAVGSSKSNGYREYKNGDGYKNEIFAISFSFLSQEQNDILENKKDTNFSIATYPKDSTSFKEFGTFFLGNYWYGFETKNLDGAIGLEGFQRDTRSDIFVGRIYYKNQFVEILNLHHYLNLQPAQDQQIILFKDTKERYVGLLIDALGPICEIPSEMIGDPKGIFPNKENFIEYIAKPPEGIHKILSIINPTLLIEKLVKQDVL